MKLLFLLFKGLKFGKLFITGGTMLLSVLVYAFIFGAPTFIPFVGAWIELKQLPHDVETEAHIGMAGPLAGTVAALLCYYFARHYDSNLLLALRDSNMSN
jgi:hypothetical protein